MRGGEASAGPSRALITASIMLATIMQGVDNTIANVALPHMQGSLSATQDQVAWMLTSYMVSAAWCGAVPAPISKRSWWPG